MSMAPRTAFVLCAGWGKRLQPLTDQVPKPLVPVCGVPLVEFALARIAASGVERIVINTHRLAGEFVRLFPRYPEPSTYAGVPVFFRHEEILLETAGGLKNVEDLLLPGPVLVHNGDILADLDLEALAAAHEGAEALCTLALRSSGGPLQIGFDTGTGRVTDIRGELGSAAPRFLYTGVCVVDPALLARVPSGQAVSFVPVWLEALRAGEVLGGVVLDGGVWRDVGTVQEYCRVHADLASGALRLAAPPTAPEGWPVWRMPGVTLGERAVLSGWNWLGPDCHVGAGAEVGNCILWAGSRVEVGASISGSVVREGMIAAGHIGDSVV
ncbi:MAG: NTP transferase domain-containing protein [Chthoniobacterales bacterium]|nr:NTP transferase domain-containing protein [Chthoniobacterales bacterium]